MLTKVRQLYRQIINPAFDPNEDYHIVRKVKFLNFTCLISAFIAVLAMAMTLLEGQYLLSLTNLVWTGILIGIIFLNRNRKIEISRALFLGLWWTYAVSGIYYLGNENFAEYYLIISILLTLILFDSFLINLILFMVLFPLFLSNGFDTQEMMNLFLRYGAFFICALFVKSLVLEVEKMLKIKHEQNLDYQLQQVEDRQKLVSAELEYKNQEIINFAFQITKKNEFIEALEKKLLNFKKENTDQELMELEELVKANQTISKDRESFEIHVQNVYEGFIAKLSSEFPELTNSEKRLATLLRLDLSSKEISTVLNISPKSVDMSRYRLRKKMELDSKVNLSEALKAY